jgi:MFS family permease
MSEENSQAKKPTIRDVLKIRDFRLLWSGQIVSNFGDNLTSLALLILVNRLTGSTAALATMAIALALPRIIFGMLAGVYVDRYDRKRIMVISDLLRAVLVFGFVFISSADRIWLLYIFAFMQATVGAFFMPARTAYIPNIVPEDGLLSANTLSETSRIIFGLLGTTVAGVFIGSFDRIWPLFALDSLTFLVSMVFILQIAAPGAERVVEKAGGAREILKSFKEGISLVLRSRILMGILVGAGVTMLGLGAVNVLLVPLVVNDLQISETWFGILEFSQTAAMVMSGALVAVLAARIKPTNIISAGLVGLGIAVVLLAPTVNVWQLMLILFLVGWIMTPLQASLTTLIQTSVSDDIRGRTSGAMGTLISTASVVSMAFAGVLGDVIGVRNVFVISGAIIVAAGIGSAFAFRGAVSAPDHMEPSTLDSG